MNQINLTDFPYKGKDITWGGKKVEVFYNYRDGSPASPSNESLLIDPLTGEGWIYKNGQHFVESGPVIGFQVAASSQPSPFTPAPVASVDNRGGDLGSSGGGQPADGRAGNDNGQQPLPAVAGGAGSNPAVSNDSVQGSVTGDNGASYGGFPPGDTSYVGFPTGPSYGGFPAGGGDSGSISYGGFPPGGPSYAGFPDGGVSAAPGSSQVTPTQDHRFMVAQAKSDDLMPISPMTSYSGFPGAPSVGSPPPATPSSSMTAAPSAPAAPAAAPVVTSAPEHRFMVAQAKSDDLMSSTPVRLADTAAPAAAPPTEVPNPIVSGPAFTVPSSQNFGDVSAGGGLTALDPGNSAHHGSRFIAE